MKRNILIPGITIMACALCLAASPAPGGPATRGAAAPPPPAPPPPEEIQAFYQSTTDRDMSGDWETLVADITRNARLQNALSKEKQADITYIRAAVNDGRPAWWNAIKQGQKTQVRANLWAATATATWDPAAKDQLQVTNAANRTVITIHWDQSDMDSAAPAEHGFTRGEVNGRDVWTTIEMARLYGGLTYQNLNSQPQEMQTRVFRYVVFRGVVTTAYYGTPRMRQWAGFLAMDAYVGSHLTNEGFIRIKPLGAMMVAEFAGNQAKYPSIKLPAVRSAENAEGTLARSLMGQLEQVRLTFAEDKALREAVREFAVANQAGVVNTGKITLGNKQIMMLDPAADREAGAERGKWLMEKLAN